MCAILYAAIVIRWSSNQICLSFNQYNRPDEALLCFVTIN